MPSNLLTGQQLKAARALIGVTQEELAEIACLNVNTVRDLERRHRIPASCSRSRECLEEALRQVGARLTSQPTAGVRIMTDRETLASSDS